MATNAANPDTSVPTPSPKNARQAVAITRDDHNWKLAKPDLNSTDGIKRNIEALWATIDRLAAYVDGDSQDPNAPQDDADRQAYERSMARHQPTTVAPAPTASASAAV